MVFFTYNIKTLVSYQVTNDHGLSCLHKLNTTIVQASLVNVRTTQKRLHNINRTTLTERKQPQLIGWIKTQLRRLSYSDESSSPF